MVNTLKSSKESKGDQDMQKRKSNTSIKAFERQSKVLSRSPMKLDSSFEVDVQLPMLI